MAYDKQKDITIDEIVIEDFKVSRVCYGEGEHKISITKRVKFTNNNGELIDTYTTKLGRVSLDIANEIADAIYKLTN